MPRIFPPWTFFLDETLWVYVVMPLCLFSLGSLAWMVLASSKSSLLFPAFRNVKRCKSCRLESFEPALACSFGRRRLGMTIMACSATHSRGVLSLFDSPTWMVSLTGVNVCDVIALRMLSTSVCPDVLTEWVSWLGGWWSIGKSRGQYFPPTSLWCASESLSVFH